MKHISDVLADVLLEVAKKMKNNNMNKTETKTMKIQPTQKREKKPRVIDLTGAEFLKKKGLPRDQANYVTTMIRMKADLHALMKLTSDPCVLEELDTMIGVMQETVEWIYALDGMDNTAA